MTVFRNTLKRIMKSKLQFAALIITPVIFLVLIAYSINSDKSSTLKAAIIDNDRTAFSAMLMKGMENKANISEVKIDGIRKSVVNGEIDYVLVIPENFTASILEGEDRQLEGYFLKNSIRSLTLQRYTEAFIASAKTIANALDGDEKNFYEALSKLDRGIKMEYQTVGQIDRLKSYTTLGMMLMFMLMSSIFFTTLILQDRENKTFYRSISAPISLKSFMLQNIFAFLIVSVLQSTLLLLSLRLIVGLYMGDAILKMHLIFVLASIASVSFGIAVSSFSKNVMQACFTGLFIVFPMTFLGGCWWNNKHSTEMIRAIGKFTPVYWLMESVDKVLNEQALSALLGEIVMVLIFSAVFFMFGTWRRSDIAR
ncbi:MAG: ABC transporter permease [Clostridia bacterium]|nr:ABC transporter permease [Clostridia bacterium]